MAECSDNSDSSLDHYTYRQRATPDAARRSSDSQWALFLRVSQTRVVPNNDQCYFQIEFSVVSPAVIRFDLASQKAELFAVAEEFRVVKFGKYAGYLILQQRRAKLANGYFDWFYLFSPDGKEVGVIGQDQNDVNLFLESL